MNESSLENPQPINSNEDLEHNDREKIDITKLSFEELGNLSKEVSNLAKKSFKRTTTDNDFMGFINANEDKVAIIERNGIYRVVGVSRKLADIQNVIARDNGIFHTGSADKEEIMQAIESVIKKFGNRIIE